jgi:hypothetical protein
MGKVGQADVCMMKRACSDAPTVTISPASAAKTHMSPDVARMNRMRRTLTKSHLKVMKIGS